MPERVSNGPIARVKPALQDAVQRVAMQWAHICFTSRLIQSFMLQGSPAGRPAKGGHAVAAHAPALGQQHPAVNSWPGAHTLEELRG